VRWNRAVLSTVAREVARSHALGILSMSSRKTKVFRARQSPQHPLQGDEGYEDDRDEGNGTVNGTHNRPVPNTVRVPHDPSDQSMRGSR
jgi:hypothetical protein